METLVEAQSRNIELRGFDTLITLPQTAAEDRDMPVIGVALGHTSPRATSNAANHGVHELQAFLDDLVRMHVCSLA
jgi:hypothetical protein